MNSLVAAAGAFGPKLATIPSPDRGVYELDLGFITVPLRMYALCIIVGIVVAIWWGEKRWQQRGGSKGTIVDIAVFAVPFGLIGGRLYHVMTDWQTYFGDGGKEPIDALKIWEGGLGIWGAIALGAVGALIACRRRGIPLPAVADAIAPGIVVAQAIGRLGNYFNQELYGGPTDLPWGLEIYQRIDPDTGVQDMLGGIAEGHIPLAGSPVHPTFLYELIWNLGVALLIVWLDRKFRLGHGRVFALYVAGYTAGRLWIELMRTDYATQVFGLRVNVWTSILVFLGAVAYLILAAKRGPREAPESLRSNDDPDYPADGDTTATHSTESGESTVDTGVAGATESAEPGNANGTADRAESDATAAGTSAETDPDGTTDETPAADETPVADETPAADETPVADETSVTDEAAAGDERKVERGQ